MSALVRGDGSTPAGITVRAPGPKAAGWYSIMDWNQCKSGGEGIAMGRGGRTPLLDVPSPQFPDQAADRDHAGVSTHGNTPVRKRDSLAYRVPCAACWLVCRALVLAQLLEVTAAVSDRLARNLVGSRAWTSRVIRSCWGCSCEDYLNSLGSLLIRVIRTLRKSNAASCF